MNGRKRVLHQMAGLLLLGIFSVAGSRGDGTDVPQTVAQVDLDRYLGGWYEIARLPNWFQNKCSANVTAHYRRRDDGRIAVTNRCLNDRGQEEVAQGVARVLDGTGSARLQVSFVSLLGWHLFWGDYWVIGLADDYRYAVVGTPDRKYGWILARTPSLSLTSRQAVRNVLVRNGYDPEKFVATPYHAPGKNE